MVLIDPLYNLYKTRFGLRISRPGVMAAPKAAWLLLLGAPLLRAEDAPLGWGSSWDTWRSRVVVTRPENVLHDSIWYIIVWYGFVW